MKLLFLNCSSPGYEVDDCNYERYDQKKMDQISSHMKTPAQQPKDDKNRENGPKHTTTFISEEQKTIRFFFQK